MNERIKEQIDSELSGITFVTDERLKRLEKPEKLSTRKDRKMKINKKFIVGGVAAAVVAGSAVTVGAVNEWNYQRVVERAFPRAVVAQTEQTRASSKEEAALAEKNAVPVPELVEQAAKTLDGLVYPVPSENFSSTFTKYDVIVDGYICDGENLYIPVSIRSKDGAPFTREGQAINYDTYFDLEADGCDVDLVSSVKFDITDDGVLQFTVQCDMRRINIDEPVNARLTGSYLVHNGPLKLAEDADVHDLPPDVLLDDGVLTANIMLYPNDSIKELVLADKTGDTVTLRISQTKMTVNFAPIPEPSYDDEKRVMLFTDVLFLYDDEGNVIFSASDMAGGGASETEGFAYCHLARPLDVSRVASARCGNYTYGSVPPIDDELCARLRDVYGITD